MTFLIKFYEKTSGGSIFSFPENETPGLALIDEVKTSTGASFCIERILSSEMDCLEMPVTEEFARSHYKLFADSRVLELFVPSNYLNEYSKWELVGNTAAKKTIDDEWLQECLTDIFDDLCILAGVVNIEDDPEDSLCFKDLLSGDWCLYTPITLMTEIDPSKPDNSGAGTFGIIPPGEDAYPFHTYRIRVVIAYLNRKMLPEGVNNEYINGEIQNFLEIYHSGDYNAAIYEIPGGILK